MVERTRRVLSLSDSLPAEIDNLRNWLDATGCISQRETEFLDDEGDLANLASPPDNAIAYTESLIEGGMYWLDRFFGKVREKKTSALTFLTQLVG